MSLFDRDPAAPPPAIAGTVTQPDPLLVTLDRRGSAPVGPCSYEPRPAAGAPPTGTRCLLTFADGDESQPWVIAFLGWPTGGA